MQERTAPSAMGRERPRDTQHDRPEQDPLPTWQNTRPRGNQEPDRAEVERSRERLEALLGR
ncbi:MAG: hypothetical protein ACRDL4_07090 [Thermoleophilaceae bacterium]